jgi:hypothetical protein
MTNSEWLLSLNKQQRRRKRKTGEIPEFAIYRIYNHCAKEWQFPDIINSDKTKVHRDFVKRIGFGVYKWRFEIQPWLIYNPILLTWKKVEYAFKRNGKEPLAGTVFLHKKVVEVMADKWLEKEHCCNEL